MRISSLLRRCVRVVPVLGLAGVLAFCGLGLGTERMPTADSILTEYASTMARIPTRFAIEAESLTTVETGTGGKNQGLTRCRYRRDGDCLDVDRLDYDLGNDGKPSTTPKYRVRAMIDREGHAIEYYGPPTTPTEVLFTADGTKERGYVRAQLASDGPLEGYLASDQVSFVELLRRAKKLQLHPRKENVQGFECYVLEASTGHGAYKVWLDPACGYLPRKAVVQKRGSDVWDHKPLNGTYLSEVDSALDSVEIQRVNGQFIPVACRIEETWRRREGGSRTMHITHKRTRIDFDPDFAALGAFKPDLSNGTKVNYQDTAAPDVAYQWMDGKVVPVDSAIRR